MKIIFKENPFKKVRNVCIRLYTTYLKITSWQKKHQSNIVFPQCPPVI